MGFRCSRTVVVAVTVLLLAAQYVHARSALPHVPKLRSVKAGVADVMTCSSCEKLVGTAINLTAVRSRLMCWCSGSHKNLLGECVVWVLYLALPA